MKKPNKISMLAGLVIVLIGCAEMVLCPSMGGHLYRDIGSRPFTVVSMLILVAIAYWAHKTQRFFVRDIALGVFLSILFSVSIE